MEPDIIGGFPYARPDCRGCGKPLVRENAWMTDGCPCNSALGVNSMNETRWRLLMQLQQKQARNLEAIKAVADQLAPPCNSPVEDGELDQDGRVIDNSSDPK